MLPSTTLRRLLCLSAGVLALSACDLAPPYQPPVIATPAAFKEAGPWQQAKPADDASRGPWWTAFGDPTLDRLEPMLEAGSADLAAQAARYDQARAFAAEAESGLYPSLGAGADFTRNRQSANRPLRGANSPNQYRQIDLDVKASYEVDLWGSARNAAAAGRATAQAGAAQLASRRLSLEAELAADYFALRGLDADAKLLADTVQAYGKALDLTRARFNGAIASGMDVSRAETQLDVARAQVSDIAGRRALLEHAIAALVGQTASTFTIPAEVPDTLVPELPVGLPSTLLERRPDVAAAERLMKAANAEVGVARAAFYPNLTLGALGGFQSTNFNLIGLPDSVWSVGPSISLPLFEGGALEAQESGAYARLRETAQTYRGTVLAAFREVEDNLGLIHWLGREAADQEAGVAAAQRTLDTAMHLYQEGATSYLDVVTAQTALLQAQQAALDVKTRRLSADVGLIRALGGGWSVKELPDADQADVLAANKAL